MASAISFDSVSKRFRSGVLALDQTSWSITTGAHACLLGPNGAGKSTSVRLLQGALRPSSGSVVLLGTPVDSATYLDARRRCGIVPQNPGMYRDLTAGEYLDMAGRLYRGKPGPVAEAFGLGPHLATRMAQLSGGFQRRLVLAAALLGDPELLLLDEPTVGLDPVASHEVHEYLRAFMQGRTTLLCTHNLAEAEALCDDVVILRAGRVIVHGSLADLRRDARPRLRLACRQGPAPLRAALNGLGALEQSDGSVLVEVANPELEAPELLRRLLGEGLDVYQCLPVQPSLADLFLEAVR